MDYAIDLDARFERATDQIEELAVHNLFTEAPKNRLVRDLVKARFDVTLDHPAISPQEKESLEVMAFEQEDSFQLGGYERAKTAENSRLLSEYRKVIVESHVRRLLGITAE